MDQSTPPAQSDTPPPTQAVIADIVAPPTPQTDVVAAPIQSAEELAEAQEAAAGQQQVPAPLAAVTKPKSPTTADTKLAIIATVVIVIALGVLATLAFLQQK